MGAMHPRHRALSPSLRLALVISLLLHGAVLFLHLVTPPMLTPQLSPPPSSRFDATLSRPSPPKAVVQPPPPSKADKSKPKNARRSAVLTAPKGRVQPRNWSVAERNDMDRFLKDLDNERRPAKGEELARRSMAMARQMGREPDADVDGGPIHASPSGKPIESLSMEMYFEAFLRKLNRSANFVKRDDRANGNRFGQVLITLNSDGSLQSYKVVRSADQQAEIDYIRNVVERASPFAAFPPDIKRATNTLTIMMCITPHGEGSGFSRIFSGSECHD
jgi:hypothetical protein